MHPATSLDSSKINDVFGIGELFEAILLELHPADLLLSQGTCRFWKQFIEASPALQSKLFFRPTSSTNKPPEINHLLQSFFPQFFDRDERPDHHHLNVLDELKNQQWYKNEESRAKVMHKDASWRRMFPIQPPPKLEAIRVYSWEACCYETEIGEGRLGRSYQHEQEHGIKMGLLYDLVRFLVDWRPDGGFMIQWHMLPMTSLKPDPYGSPYALFSTDPEFPNKITLHYHHTDFCGGYKVYPTGMTITECGEDIIEILDDSEQQVPGFPPSLSMRDALEVEKKVVV